MPDLVVVLLLSAFACRSVGFVVYTFVFADGVPVLAPGALVACFLKLRIVRLVVAYGAVAEKNLSNAFWHHFS